MVAGQSEGNELSGIIGSIETLLSHAVCCRSAPCQPTCKEKGGSAILFGLSGIALLLAISASHPAF